MPPLEDTIINVPLPIVTLQEDNQDERADVVFAAPNNIEAISAKLKNHPVNSVCIRPNGEVAIPATGFPPFWPGFSDNLIVRQRNPSYKETLEHHIANHTVTLAPKLSFITTLTSVVQPPPRSYRDITNPEHFFQFCAINLQIILYEPRCDYSVISRLISDFFPNVLFTGRNDSRSIDFERAFSTERRQISRGQYTTWVIYLDQGNGNLLTKAIGLAKAPPELVELINRPPRRMKFTNFKSRLDHALRNAALVRETDLVSIVASTLAMFLPDHLAIYSPPQAPKICNVINAIV